MHSLHRLLLVLILIAVSVSPAERLYADTGESTRVIDAHQYARSDPAGYPYRAKSEYVLKELDLKPGDVVVDIGAGDGWWAEKMAKLVGGEGIVYAAEIDQKDVNSMKQKFADVSQIKPYLCEARSSGLPENSCELAFLSQTYHHLDSTGRVDYLRHLSKVVKPTGRVSVIEKYANIGTRSKTHGTPLSRLAREAEEAGWIPIRCELITGTHYYIAIFVQKGLFQSKKAPDETGRNGVSAGTRANAEPGSSVSRRFRWLRRRNDR